MAVNKFKTGDVVRHKSGGPRMTVRQYALIQLSNGESYPSDSDVECEWFNNTKIESGIFHQDTIEIINEETPSIIIGTRTNKYRY